MTEAMPLSIKMKGLVTFCPFFEAKGDDEEKGSSAERGANEEGKERDFVGFEHGFEVSGEVVGNGRREKPNAHHQRDHACRAEFGDEREADGAQAELAAGMNKVDADEEEHVCFLDDFTAFTANDCGLTRIEQGKT